MKRNSDSDPAISKLGFSASEECSPQSTQQLWDLVKEKPEIRREIVRYMVLRANLAWLFSNPAGEGEHKAAVLEPIVTRLSRRAVPRIGHWLIGLACLVGVGSLLWGWSPDQVRLVEAKQCISNATDRPLVPGKLSDGAMFAYQGGLAQVEFPGQVRMLTRGNCEWKVESPQHLRMSQGLVSLSVPERREPFVVSLPRGELRCSGAQATIRVLPDGQADVRLTKGTLESTGEIRVVDLTRPQPAGEGESPGDLLSARPIVDLTFPSGAWSYSSLVESAAPTLRWNAQTLGVDEINREVPWRRSLAGHPSLTLYGELTARPGRLGHVLDFQESPDGSYIRRNEPLPVLQGDEFSIELAVQPQAARLGTILAVKHWTDERPQPIDSLLVEVAPQGFPPGLQKPADTFRVVYRERPAAEGPVSIFSPVGLFQIGRWYHVVVVKQSHQIDLWIDGRRVGSSPVSGPLARHDYVVLGDLLGTRDLPTYPILLRPFIGQIAECAIYDRAVTDQDIVLHADVLHQELKNAANVR